MTTTGGDTAVLVVQVLDGTPVVRAGPPEVLFARAGDVTVVVGQGRWYARAAWTVSAVLVSVGTAPVGASLIADVKKNGTTIFTTTGNRPTILAGSHEAESGTPDDVVLAPGDYLTVDVVQVGSTTPGADLTVQIALL